MNIKSDEALVLATLLDPCFKDKFFSSIVERENAKELLIMKMEIISDTNSQKNMEPPEKRPRTAVMKFWKKQVCTCQYHPHLL